ncbi:MAG: winged helix-turn-helix domain-containing protein [Oscillospiraceae bacterium]
MTAQKYIEAPGYLYDLFNIFINHYKISSSKQLYIKDIIEKDIKNSEYINKFFSPINDELFIFFNTNNSENNTPFIFNYYFNYISSFDDVIITDKHEIVDLLFKNLENEYSVKYNLYSYYLYNCNPSEIDKFTKDIVAFANEVDKSNYSDKIKRILYSVAINFTKYHQILIDELKLKVQLLNKYYEKNQLKIEGFKNNFSFFEYYKKLQEFENITTNEINKKDDIYISTSLINPFLFNYVKSEKNYYLSIVGYEFEDNIKVLKEQYSSIDINTFANAISEKNRTEILDLMLEKGSLTAKQLEKLIESSSTNTYYHITLMLKLNILYSTAKGRTIYYNINKNCFDKAIDYLSKYSTKNNI